MDRRSFLKISSLVTLATIIPVKLWAEIPKQAIPLDVLKEYIKTHSVILSLSPERHKIEKTSGIIKVTGCYSCNPSSVGFGPNGSCNSFDYFTLEPSGNDTFNESLEATTKQCIFLEETYLDNWSCYPVDRDLIT